MPDLVSSERLVILHLSFVGEKMGGGDRERPQLLRDDPFSFSNCRAWKGLSRCLKCLHSIKVLKQILQAVSKDSLSLF